MNPSGRLLAAVGTHELAIVILPRRGYMRQVGARIGVCAVRVGAFYHAQHGNAAIAECQWHPLGDGGSSLFVLTDDALLREYDVVSDVDEPQQSILCIKSSMASSRSATLSANDDDQTCAVGFALGCGSDEARSSPSASHLWSTCAPNWLYLTVFVLMRNGDIWALCPVMPKRALVSPAAIRAIAAYEDAQSHNEPSAGVQRLQRRYLVSLLRQLSSNEPDVLAADLSASHLAPPPQEDEADAPVQVTAPGTVPNRIQPQGPLLLRPSPRELSDEDAPVSSDIAFVHLAPAEGAPAWLDVLCVTTRDGRVDVCLLLERIRPAWVQATQKAQAQPTLAVYESVDLQLAETRTSTDLNENNYVQLLPDPLYPDTFFVVHADGVDVLSMRPWTSGLLASMRTGDTLAISGALAENAHSDVTHLVRSSPQTANEGILGAVVVNEVYLSYFLCALTAGADIVATELNLRTARDNVGSEGEAKPAEAAATPAYQSLLAKNGAFEGAALVTAAGAARAPSAPAKGAELRATPQDLRAFGRAAEDIHKRVRDVVHAANAVQARLDVQLHEMTRQLQHLDSLRQRATQLCGDNGADPAVVARLASVQRQQQKTLQRVDSLLQRLMEGHQPQLSVYERRWFDELQRMAREFGVDTSKAPSPAHDRLQKLAHQLEVLRPSLWQYKQRMDEQMPSAMLGTAQLKRIETILAQEAHVLTQARHKVQQLQMAVGERR